MSPTLLILFVILTISLMFLSNPLSMGIALLIMALLATMLLSYQTSSLLAMMLFLIYVGGVMMMFAYFLSCCPNTKNPYSGFNMKFTPLLIIITTPLLIPMNTYTMNFSSHLDQKILLPMESPQSLSILLLMMLLLLTMLIVVKIATLRAGPMRPFKNM
nr:NADH dehydrogenase subunit 6 [Sabella spallanzanii]